MFVRSTVLPLLFASAIVVHAQGVAPAREATPTGAIPMDPAVRVGRLPNGLRYYIRRNARPEHRAELRLVVNAGSIVEDDDQRGLAHFVEHMLFNGTRRFAKNDIVSYLESIGVRFGADLNAQTGFDETIYILPVPTDKPGLLDRSFDILEDWAGAALFDSTEVVNERGVVLEEWRGGLGAETRIRDQQFPVIFKGSRYADRLPIGLPEVIRNANPAPLRRFYRDWYRPDLMAVIAVGDVNPVQIERMIRQRFGRLRPVARPRPRTGFPVPANQAPLVTIATDPEEQVTSVGVLYKHARRSVRTAADYRKSLVASLYNDMLNRRFAELSRKPDAAFSVASSGYGGFVRGTDAYQLVAVTREGATIPALESVLTEARRVRTHGFLPAELTRAKAAFLRAYESAWAEREKTESGDFVQEYVQHFLEGDPSPGIAWELRAVRTMLPGITVEDVNALGRQWITDENRVVMVSAPAKEGAKAPTAEELLAVFPRVEAATVAAWTESVSDAPLVAEPPAPGRVVSTSTMPELGVTEWKLSNGVRVLLKPTDFKADEVLLRGWSPGGASLVADADVPTATLATTLVERGGAGTFDAIALGKKLTGIQARAGTFIDDDSEGVTGSASPRDLSTLFQLTWARLITPRRDSAAFIAFRNQVRPFLANRATNPEAVFGDTVSQTMSRYSPRALPVNAEYLDRVSYDRAFAIFRERFTDFSDYTFVLVGAFAIDSVRPLVEQWLGALPGGGRPEVARDAGVRPPDGRIEKRVHKGVEPKAMTVVIYHGAAEFAPTERHALRSVTEYVEMKALESLREALGGTYSVGVGGTLQRWPIPSYTVSVQFGSSPQRADSLYAAVRTVIDSAKAGVISDADVAKIREQQQRAYEVNLRENSYWLLNLSSRIENHEDPKGLLAYPEFIRGLTKESLQAAARRYFSDANIARFVLLPERTTP
ncbi:MAG: insulinase family protein [Gemmatimonadaceae bacterium]|nr:insulinase family protein [Gemmatimonadaceae bacterium]